jgi:hypothetical protein
MITDPLVSGKLIANLIFISLSFMIGCDQSILAQARGEPARKFDEFGDVQYSDLIARLDNFAIALQGQPNAKGFIVAYRSRRDLPGLSNRTALRSKDYLVNSRGVQRGRLVTVDGGDADCLTQELWVALPGTTPTPRGDAYSRNFPDVDSARKFDEYGYDLVEARHQASQSSTEADFLEPFANALRSQEHSLAYVIAYAHFTKSRQLVGGDNYDFHYERHMDPVGAAQRRLVFEKRVLIGAYGIAPARIRLIDGGYRKWRAVELWIVPRGEHAPIPTPNSFPPQRARSQK